MRGRDDTAKEAEADISLKTRYNDPLVNATIALLTRVKPSIDELKSLSDEWPTLFGNVTESLNTGIPGYQSKLESNNVLSFYECLKQIGEKASALDDLKSNMVIVRSLGSSSNIFKEAANGVNAILNLKSKFPEVQKAVGKIMGSQEVTVKALKSTMSNAKEHSKKLGMAVQGLQRMTDAEREKGQLEGLINQNLDFIKTSADSHRSSLTTDEYSALVKIKDLKADLARN